MTQKKESRIEIELKAETIAKANLSANLKKAMSSLNVDLQTSFMSFRPAGEILALLGV